MGRLKRRAIGEPVKFVRRNSCNKSDRPLSRPRDTLHSLAVEENSEVRQTTMDHGAGGSSVIASLLHIGTVCLIHASIVISSTVTTTELQASLKSVTDFSFQKAEQLHDHCTLHRLPRPKLFI